MLDRERGVYADAGKVQPIDHRGHALPGRRPAQRRRARRRATRCWCRPDRPRTARSSPPGTPRPCSPPSRPSPTGRPSTRTSSRRLAAYGRAPRTSCKILPGICPVIGSTEAEALRAGAGARRSCIVPEYGAAPAVGDARRGPDRTCRWTARCPTLPEERDINGNKSRFTLVAELARRERARPSAQLIAPARRRPRPPGLRRDARADRRPARGVVRRRAPPTASTSCRRTCPAVWRTSSTTSSRSCRTAGCSAPSTAGRTLREHYGLARPAGRLAPAVTATEGQPA